MLRADGDPDPRSPRDRAGYDLAVLDEQTITDQVDPILRQRDAHRDGQVSGTATQIVHVATGAAASPPHHGDAIDRIERANENRCRRSLCFGDDVDEVVNAVIEVDVRVPGRAVQRLVAPRWTRRGMTGGIRLADVGFDFHDGAARAHAATIVNENLSEEIFRDVERRPVVERARQFHDV